jgi:hypothetical protein
MLMDDDCWYVVRHTPGVSKFVGCQMKPIPAKDVEIKRILLKDQRTGTTVAKIEIDLNWLEAMVGRFLGGEFKLLATFSILLIVLVVRPYGLFGTHEIERL